MLINQWLTSLLEKSEFGIIFVSTAFVNSISISASARFSELSTTNTVTVCFPNTLPNSKSPKSISNNPVLFPSTLSVAVIPFKAYFFNVSTSSMLPGSTQL